MFRHRTVLSDQKSDCTGMPQPADPAPRSKQPRTRLRLLATSDVHAAVLPYDYATGRVAGCFGLARAASLIARARHEARGQCLLFDNGDFLQGSPLSDLHDLSDPATAHPVITAMNTLGYDAANLGNHEFNFGLDPLHRALAQARFPVICSNALTRRGASVTDDETLLPPSLLVEKQLADEFGHTHKLKIGLLGVLPPQIMDWDRFHLGQEICVRDMIETVAARVPMLRAEGADLVILLAHTGIDRGPPQAGMENAALTLAQIPGIDAIIAGHSHELFPQPGMVHPVTGADHARGTFHGVPAVMPGFRASHLGVIDLHLTHDQNGWQVANHRAQLWPVKLETGAPVPADPAVAASVKRCHTTMLSRMAEPLGHSKVPIHSYLSQYRNDLPVRLVAEAQRAAVAAALSDGPYGGLPVVSATAPFNTGGRAGPDAYTDIPAGPLTLRNMIDLQPFPNTLCAVLATGAELRDWLERSVSCYFQIQPHKQEQPLWNPAFPGHASDVIAGLTYRIDLTQPPLYDENGQRAQARRGRIQTLLHLGRPVPDNIRFVMAVNNYRAFGGGPYPALPADRLIYTSTMPVRDVLTEFVRSGGNNRMSLSPDWSFLPVPGACVLLKTGEGILHHADELAALEITSHYQTDDGFLRLRMPLYSAACESAV